jgi:glycosyltransferase involved in cell wall biosynthesis
MTLAVWIVNQYAISPDLPGGTRHYDLATELTRRGIAVKIFAADVNLALRQHVRLRGGELFKRERAGDVEFVWIDSALYRRNDWRRAWNMFSFYRNAILVGKTIGQSEPPAVIIGSSPHPLAALAALRLSRRLGASFVLEVRDLWPQSLIDGRGFSNRHPLMMAMRMVESYLYRKATRIIVLARGSIDYIAGRGFPRQRIIFIPNGVHVGHFQTTLSRDEARQHYGFKDFTVVYAGAHGPANALETILFAAERTADLPVTFVLVGSGPSKDDLVAKASSRKLTNVRFLEPISKNDIPNLLLAADAGAITLRDYSTYSYGISPNKLFDYMAAALPVICSVRGDMASIVKDAGCGIPVPPEDPEALASAVRTLRGMPEVELRLLGNAGRNYVTRHFSREVLAERLFQVIDETTARR